MSIFVKEFFDLDTSTFTYIITDVNTKVSAIIDPVTNFNQFSGLVSYTNADILINYVTENKLKVEWVLETHIHADHITAANYLRSQLGAKIGIGSKIVQVLEYWVPFFDLLNEDLTNKIPFDALFDDQQLIKLGSSNIKVLDTPGHTPSCISYYVDDCIFVGDTLFKPDVGTARTDFPGGDPKILYESIKKILSLPPEVKIYVCHDYPPNTRQHECLTTVIEQNMKNIMINADVSMEEFVHNRKIRDSNLSIPRLLYPALQTNLRAGSFGAINSNGKLFIKIPILFN